MKKLMIGLLSLACVFSAQSADRLVVAGGSLSELIYAMGVGNRVVGVDETTSYPPETAALPHIGYWKQLSSEGILSLHPDSFITWQDAGPQIVLDQLRAQKVNVVTLPRVPATVEQMYANIRELAQTLRIPEQGEALVNPCINVWIVFSTAWRRKMRRSKPCSFSPLAAARRRSPARAALPMPL